MPKSSTQSDWIIFFSGTLGENTLNLKSKALQLRNFRIGCLPWPLAVQGLRCPYWHIQHSAPHWELEALAPRLDPSHPNSTKTLGFPRRNHANYANQLIATEWHIHVHNLLQEGVAASVHLDQCLQKSPAKFKSLQDCIQIPKLQNHPKVSYHLPIVQQPLTDLILALWYDTGPYQLSMFGNSPKILPLPIQWGLKKVL